MRGTDARSDGNGNILRNKRIFIDTETTGFRPPQAELLQIAVADGDGRQLLSTYVRPEHTDSWDDAARINGITPEMVADAPSAREVAPRVQALIDGAGEVFIYNAPFDRGFLEAVGVSFEGVEVRDTMAEFAEATGVWDSRHGHWRYWKLADAAKAVGYASHIAHDAMGDVLATVAVQGWVDKGGNEREG